MVCLAISTAIWFLIALSKPYTTFVEFDTRYTNLPEDKLLVHKLPDQIAVRVTAQGFTLLSWKMGVSGSTLDIDVSKFPVEKRINRQIINVVTGDLLEQLSRQLGSHSDITRDNILPDTISVVLSDSFSKSVPVIANHRLTFAKDFELDGDIETQPSVVDIYGPRAILDTINVLYTEQVSLEDVDGPKDLVSRLMFPNPAGNVRVEPEKVFVKIPADQYTAGSIMVPIVVKNVPDSFAVRTFPDSIRVDYNIGMRRGVLSSSQFKAEIILPDTADIEDYRKLPVELMRHPDYIKVSRHEPHRVEFIFRKKE